MTITARNRPGNPRIVPTTGLGWVGLVLLVVSIGVVVVVLPFDSWLGGLQVGGLWVFGSSGLAFQVIAASGIGGFVAAVAAVAFRHERSILGVGASVVGLLWMVMGLLFYRYATSG
jgi:hypothetical protein